LGGGGGGAPIGWVSNGGGGGGGAVTGWVSSPGDGSTEAHPAMAAKPMIMKAANTFFIIIDVLQISF
jgi:hypothetical protein